MEQKLDNSTEPQHDAKLPVISRFFLRQYYKLFFYEGRGNNRSKGKFKVLYNDGRYSENMCYKVAKDYASIFGGKVMDAF